MRSDGAKGVGGILLAAMLFTVMAAGTRYAAMYGVTNWQTTIFRFASGFVVLAALWAARVIKLEFHNLPWLMMRGLFGGAAICCYFFALSYGTLTNSVLLNASYPIFVALFSSVFIGERVRGFVFPLLLAAFAGIALIIRPVPGHFSPADLVALASAVLASLGILTLRRLRETENVWSILFALNGIGMVLAGVGMFVSRAVTDAPAATPAPGGVAAMVAVAMASNMAQVCLTYAYKYIRASEGSILIKVSVVLSAAIGYFVFGEKIDAVLVAGAALVLGSGALLTWFIHRAAAREEIEAAPGNGAHY